jgi:aspartyl-tRNA(Asn)/glutamyl-tRNA(Gln) amidotransferase subunit C
MISKEEIKKLADLARIEMEEEEMQQLSGEMDAILNYVGQVKEVAGKTGFPSPDQGEGHAIAGGGVNIMREDQNPTESETHSQELIAEFPKSENNYLKVKKIL